MRVEFNKEVESWKKTQTELKLEMKNLGGQTKTSDVGLTNRVQEWKREFKSRRQVGRNV